MFLKDRKKEKSPAKCGILSCKKILLVGKVFMRRPVGRGGGGGGGYIDDIHNFKHLANPFQC